MLEFDLKYESFLNDEFDLTDDCRVCLWCILPKPIMKNKL